MRSRLAEDVRLVATDLAGFGQSERRDTPPPVWALDEFLVPIALALAFGLGSPREVGTGTGRFGPGLYPAWLRSLVLGGGDGSGSAGAVAFQLDGALKGWVEASDITGFGGVDPRRIVVGAIAAIGRHARADSAREDCLSSYEGRSFVAPMRRVCPGLVRHHRAEPLAKLAIRVSAVRPTCEGRTVVAAGARRLAALAGEFEAVGSLPRVDLPRAEPVRAELPRVELDHAAVRRRNVAVAQLRSQLTPRMADLPALDVAGALEPVDGVLAGDWFDLCGVGNRGWALILVDVSGHGAEAGILAWRLKQLLIPVLADGMSPGAALLWATRHAGNQKNGGNGGNGSNEGTAYDGDDGDDADRFATALVVVGSLDDDAISYANAGHPPPFLGRPGRLRRLAPTGPLLSPFLADLGWRTATDRLVVGERLIAYTDGMVEARAADGTEFGEERLADILDAEHGCADSVVTAALAAVRGFRDKARDDSTIAVIQRVHDDEDADHRTRFRPPGRY
jgi:hypothetical protein